MRRHPWPVAFAAAGLVIAVLRLAGLDVTPPGLYNDEASIGYNAWSLAHHGVDEHGHSFPLYFEAFGEYKNPLYIYLLAPLTLVLPLTPYVERLPAALCGLGTVALVALTAWTLTRRAAVAFCALLVAASTPWLALQSRVGFELPVMTLTLTLALYCFVRATHPAGHLERWDWRWLAACGVALGLSVFAYSSGRAFVVGAVVVMVIVDRRWRRPQALPLLAPVLMSYAVLGLYARAHPGNLTERFSAVSITADSPGLLTEAGRLVRNYATYWGVPFLFTNGDSNLRHNTGYGGMLLVTTLPLVVLGLVACVRRWRQPLPRLLLGLLLVAPVPAALTAEGTPHALRADCMLPPLLVVMVLGLGELLPWVRRRRLLLAGVALALAVDAGGYMWDLQVRYPGRALASFDAGELAAIHRAHDLAAPGGHHVYVSQALDVPYIQVLFALTPPPLALPWPDNAAPAMAQVGVSVLPSAADITATAQPGDLLVIGPGEQPPPGASLVETEEVSVAADSVTLPPELSGRPASDRVVLAAVYRR